MSLISSMSWVSLTFLISLMSLRSLRSVDVVCVHDVDGVVASRRCHWCRWCLSLSLSLSWPPAPPWWGGAGAGIIIPTGIIILGVRSSWTPPTAEARHQTTPWAGLMGRGWKGASALPARLIHANHNIVCMYGFVCERAYRHSTYSHIKNFSFWNSGNSY